MEQQALLWFQKDLRVQDNACLEEIFKNFQRAEAVVFKPSHQSPLQSQFHAQTVFASQAYNSHDLHVLETVELALKKDTKAQFTIIDQSTLLNQEVYSALVENLPSSFTPFRKQVEESWTLQQQRVPFDSNLKRRDFK